jgi:hypothetical protein
MPGIASALTDSGTPFSILTKGTLLRRDLPLLREAAASVPVSIAMSIAVFDDALQKIVEPGTPSAAARLDTVRAATEAGFRVTACDASPAMVERTEALARAHGVEVSTRVCRWDQLPDQGWQDRFDAVFCVGNSLAHAVGRSGRRAALDGMAFVLATDGVLALTSRNWEQIRSAGSRLDVWDRLVERAGRKAVVAYL